MKKLLLLISGLLLISTAIAQKTPERIFSQLEGHWEGAFIKKNAYQKLEVQFFKKDTAYFSLQIMEEWHPQFGEFELPVTINANGIIETNTGHGQAKLRLDEDNLEITGLIDGSDPLMNVHLKKVPSPPAVDYTAEEIRFKNGDIELYGHLHRHKLRDSKTAIIVVGGRGCYAGSTKYDLTAKLLRKYGITTLVFNKRGTGKSGGNCDIATISDLASDVNAAKAYLESLDYEFENIGIIGSSAGGWVMVKAEETADYDFLISIVGPSTSVRDQQMQSAEYGAKTMGYSEEILKAIKDYTNLVFDAPATKQSFKEFSKQLEEAEKNGWKGEMLDGTDIPADASAIANLWVRRHGYDPGGELSDFNKPFLAIYGENDWIVPYRENVARLKELFQGKRSDLLRTVVAHQAGHGTEVEGKEIKLESGESYFRYFRISPHIMIEIIDFLKDNGFIE